MPDTARKIAWIKQQTVVLVYQASRGKSPALYAELFLDNLPPFLPEAEVLEQMQGEGAMQKLAMLNSKVLTFPEWFEEFRKEVVTMIETKAQPGEVIEHGQPGAEETGEDQFDVGTGEG